MRYDTLGDWFADDSGLCIQVSDEVPPDEQFLMALHELVEWKLCAIRGIPQSAVDEFDLKFTGVGEPGDDPAAPYRREHRFSMLVEMLMAHEMGLLGYGKVE